MRPDQPHRRGGMPLEVGAAYTQIIGESTSATLDQTVATDRKALVALLVGAGVLSALYMARTFWEQQGRSRARNVALKELLGDSDEKEKAVRGSMPGAVGGLGALSSSSSETKLDPNGKRRQRASSKSGDASKRTHQKTQKDPKNEASELSTSSPKSLAPGSPGPSASAPSSNQSVDNSKPRDIDPSTTSQETRENVEQNAAPVEDDPTSSMTAAERKKAKKKQTRANRQRQQVATPASSESDAAGSSTDISASAMSPVQGALVLDENETLRGHVATTLPSTSRTTEKDSNDGDADLITPTATAHTTPKPKSRSKMESQLEASEQSPSGTRNLSVASSDASHEEQDRGRNDSAPSLSHTLSPKSASERSASIQSLDPATPPTPSKMLKGLNLLDANFVSLKDQEDVADWQEVARGGKTKKKKRTEDDGQNTRASLLASPPESSVSPLSSSSYQLPNMDAVSAQTQTEATSTSWISEQTPCQECEHWKQSEAESAAAKASAERDLAQLKDQLAKTEQDEKRQRDLVKSLTATNTSLSERTDHMRTERDALESKSTAADEKMRSLEADLAKGRERIKQLMADAERQEKRRRELEKTNEDWKSSYDQLLKNYNDHKQRTTNQMDQATRTAAQKDAQIVDLTRVIGNYQAMAATTGGPMMTQNPNQQYQMMPPQMMMPQTNASPMTPGFGGVPQGWVQQGYAVPQLAPAYSQYNNGAQHVPAQQPPRMRYERGPPSAQALPTDQVYDQLSGMWGLTSPTAASSRVPPSPSRNAEISTSILKRGPSAEPVAGGSHVPELPAAVALQQVEPTAEATPSASAPEIHHSLESHRIRTPPLGRKSQSERLSEKPVETRSAPSGRIDPGPGPVRPPLPITDLDFSKPQRSPAARAADPTGNPSEPSEAVATEQVQITVQEGTPIEEPTPPAPVEDEYEEPVFASIRPRD